MACWSSDQLVGPSYLQFLPPQNMEHNLASVIDRRSTSDSAPYFAVATVAATHKDFVNANIIGTGNNCSHTLHNFSNLDVTAIIINFQWLAHLLELLYAYAMLLFDKVMHIV